MIPRGGGSLASSSWRVFESETRTRAVLAVVVEGFRVWEGLLSIHDEGLLCVELRFEGLG